MLQHIPDAGNLATELEIIIIDNNSSDNTKSVIHDFAKTCRYELIYGHCSDPGLSNARNSGIQKSNGEWIVFTDDDCYLDKDYFSQFAKEVDVNEFQFGSGQIKLFDPEDDPRIAKLTLKRRTLIPAFQFIQAGVVQGANMFFHRSVFDKTGFFNPLMGAGTPFACEDIEMACRASLAGFRGAQIPELIVHHHHGRKLSSPEALETLEGYDTARGAYYASILIQFGLKEIFDVWKEQTNNDEQVLLQLAREFKGASDYISLVTSANCAALH